MLTCYVELKATPEDLVTFINQAKAVWIKERAARNNGPWEGQHPIREAIHEVEDLYNYLSLDNLTDLRVADYGLLTTIAMIGANLYKLNNYLTTIKGEAAMQTFSIREP